MMINSYLKPKIGLFFLFILVSKESIAQNNSADCVDRVEISLGAECNSAFPYEAFNSWRPSCLIIKDLEGSTLAAISGEPNIINTEKLSCAIPIDSIWFKTSRKVKVRVHQIPGWTRNCDELLNPDSVWIRKQDMPPPLIENLGCNRDTFWVPGGIIIGGAISPINRVVVIPLDYDADIPDCPEHTELELRTDGFFQFRDSIAEYSIEIFNKIVYRVDTFSHNAPLQWVKGTQLVNVNGVIDTVHGYKYTPADGEFIKIGPELCAFPEVYKENKTHFDGPNKLTPGQYEFNSYSSDSSNFCWGEINIEYKLWPDLKSRKDTISCVDVSDYSRAETYEYNSKSVTKLQEVCEWTEQIIRGGTAEIPLTAMRTVDYVSNEINKNIRHCYTHTVTHEDYYDRDFEWLCDTVVKIRTFYTDHPAHDKKNIAELARDTLFITPIPFDSIKFPDSIFAIKCGVLPSDLDDPKVIAEYLYHAFDHSDFIDNEVVVDYDPNTTKYETQSSCDAFGNQYKSMNHDQYLNWQKVFQHADYNNWGVRKAFPYINRHTKTIDSNLKAKLINAGAHPLNNADLWTLDYVSIPINKAICNINATRSDLHQVEACSGERTIYRTWTLLDWCNGKSKESTQIIRIIDNEAPELLSLDGQNLSLNGDRDDDNSQGKEDHYFGRNDINNHSGNDDLEDDDSANNANVKIDVKGYGTLGVHWIKVDESWGCFASYTFPTPEILEHCSESSYTYELLDNNWKSDGNTYERGESVDISWLHGEGLSKPIVKLKVWDECGNELVYFYYLKAIDKIPPVVELHNYLFVSLTRDEIEQGNAKIHCKDVDAGSHDGDCGPVICELRREGTEVWGSSVHFECQDIGSVFIEVQVTDYSGNTAMGTMVVQLKNKNEPLINCEDVTIDCIDPIDPEWTGFPHADGICDEVDLEYEDEYHVNDLCFEGTITRTWTIRNTEASCNQIITIKSTDNGSDNSTFDPVSIQWPLHNTGESLSEIRLQKDWTLVRSVDAHGDCIERSLTDTEYRSFEMDDLFECELGNLKEPIWEDPACGLIGKTYEDQQVNFNDGVCFKILRSWVVIDWCIYDSKEGNIYNNEEEYVNDLCVEKQYFRIKVNEGDSYIDGYYTYVQEIKVKDETPPILSVQKNIEIEIGTGSKVDIGDCSGLAIVTGSAEDFCNNLNISGLEGDDTNAPKLDWYVQLVKIDEINDKEEIIKDSQGRSWRPVANGGNEVRHEELNSDEGNFTSASFSFEGNANDVFYVKWRVEDGCNNRAESLTKITFKDVKAPILQCYGNLSTNAMNTDGVVSIWANDFGEAFDCGGDNVTVWFKNEDGDLVSSLNFDCMDLEGNAAIDKDLKVYALDQSSNESFCSTTLRIIDSNDACGNGDLTNGVAMIHGEVRTEDGLMNEGVEISMLSKVQMTESDGQFAFRDIPKGQNYNIDAEKEDEYLNGVSTLDLVLIQKHILGTEQLNSPYKVIAADINNDERVSSLDLVELRKLILNITPKLSNNSSWRFVDSDQVFIDKSNPFPVKESLQFDFLTEDTKKDLISVKVGDVNGNAKPNSHVTDSRNASTLYFKSNYESLKRGNLITIPFESQDFKDIQALQFSLEFYDLEFLDIQSGSIEVGRQNLGIFENALTIAWTDIKSHSAEDPLFFLVFEVLKDIRLESAISMSSIKTKAVAYNSEYAEKDVKLRFVNQKNKLELFHNVPNPFHNQTIIRYNMTENEEVSFSVFDLSGHTILTDKIQSVKGYNEIHVSKSQLRHAGVYYYQLETQSSLSSGKMILID